MTPIQLCEKLAKWHWSPEFPTSYVTPQGAGLGKVAFDNPAAFNLAWLRHSKQLTTIDDHKAAVNYFVTVGRILDTPLINKHPIDIFVTTLSAPAFKIVYDRNRATLPANVSSIIDLAFANGPLPNVQRF